MPGVKAQRPINDILLFILVAILLSAFVFLRPSHGSEALKLQYRYSEDGKVVTGTGTCFAVAADKILTASHLLYSDGVLRPSFVIVDGRERKVTLRLEDKSLDLALCLVEGGGLTPVAFQDAAEIRDEIIFDGFPRGVFASYRGLVWERYFKGSARDKARIQFDHGMSGCPVIQEYIDGKTGVPTRYVVGMAIAGIPKDGDMSHEYGLYLPASVLRWFLRDRTLETPMPK